MCPRIVLQDPITRIVLQHESESLKDKTSGAGDQLRLDPATFWFLRARAVVSRVEVYRFLYFFLNLV